MNKSPITRAGSTIWRVTALALATVAFPVIGQAATSVTDGPITWTFSADRQVGQYCTGDWWVVGPVTVTAISPGPATAETRTINGSMLTPSGAANGFVSTGWDSDVSGYTASKNVALSLPLTITTGSLMSSKSNNPKPSARVVLSDMRVLTVVSSAPAAGAFRPPYCGPDKTSYWNINNLNYSILPDLAPVAGSPMPSSVAGLWGSGPWIEVDTHTWQRETHPSKNMPLGATGVYGREIGLAVSRGLLALCLDYPDADKQALYMRIVQYGIDIYGTAKSGGQWPNNGGYNLGRKGAILLAGLALRDSSILDYANKEKHFIFQDDQNYWIVSQSDIGRTLKQGVNQAVPEQYTSGMVGMPEWGVQHTGSPEYDTAGGQAYRDVNFAANSGYALAARLISGMQAASNWDAPYLYYDRAFGYTTGTGWRTPFPSSTTTPETFVKNMWASYRMSAGGTQTRVSTPVAVPGSTGFQSPISVSISCATAGATVHYTTDGTTPTTGSPVYSSSIQISETTTIKAIGVNSGMTASTVMSESYTFAEFSSSATWQSLPLSSPQSGSFTLTWIATPMVTQIDSITGLAAGEADTYSDLACIVRFNKEGTIDARNGSTYSAVNSLSYSAGIQYLIAVSIDIGSKTYDVMVTPAGGVPALIADDFAFRTEQASASQIGYLVLYASSGFHTVNDIVLSGGSTTPNTPLNLELSANSL